jgi:DNA-binding transcriptional MerR regulator
MKMRKKTFRIGELAKKLTIERFVIRFWEKEFQVKTDRSCGGQRFYTEQNFERFVSDYSQTH